MGYTKTTKIWKLKDLEAKRMIRSTDVIFAEEENAIKEPETVNLNYFPKESETTKEPDSETGLRKESETQERNSELDLIKHSENTQTEDPNDALLRQIDEDLARLTASEADYALNAQISEILEDAEPLTFQKALNSPRRKEWIEGIRDELRSMYLNGIWDTATSKNSNDKRAIDSKWVF